MADKSFLTGLMLIVFAGALLILLKDNLAGLSLVLTILLALLVLTTFLFLQNTAKAHMLFLLFFVAGVIYTGLTYLTGQGDFDLVLLVVGVASLIGFMSAINVPKPIREIPPKPVKVKKTAPKKIVKKTTKKRKKKTTKKK